VVVFYLRQSNFVVFRWISVFIVGHFWHASSRLVTTSIYVRRYAVRRSIVNSVFEATSITDCRCSIFSSGGVLTFELTITCMGCLIATAAIGLAF